MSSIAASIPTSIATDEFAQALLSRADDEITLGNLELMEYISDVGASHSLSQQGHMLDLALTAFYSTFDPTIAAARKAAARDVIDLKNREWNLGRKNPTIGTGDDERPMTTSEVTEELATIEAKLPAAINKRDEAGLEMFRDVRAKARDYLAQREK